MTGARLGLPEKLVPRASTTRSGSRWTSAQGQIQIETFRLAEASLPALFEEEKKANRRQIELSDLKSDSFVVTGTQGLKNFMVRAAARGGEVRGLTILYDQATQGTMESVAHAMAAAFTAFPDPNAPASAGNTPRGRVRQRDRGRCWRRSGCAGTCHCGLPDYYRAAVRACRPSCGGPDQRSCAHPPLRRAYLLPMQFGEGNESGDLTVIGVADPVAQAGSAVATSSTAHPTAHGVDPAPKPGFSGGAAVDLHGVLAGMVECEVGSSRRKRARRAFRCAGAGRHHSRFPAGTR